MHATGLTGDLNAIGNLLCTHIPDRSIHPQPRRHQPLNNTGHNLQHIGVIRPHQHPSHPLILHHLDRRLELLPQRRYHWTTVQNEVLGFVDLDGLLLHAVFGLVELGSKSVEEGLGVVR